MERNDHDVERASDKETMQTIEELRSGLDLLEQTYPASTPDLEWFQQMTAAKKRKARRKMVRDLAFFWLVAVIVLSVYFVVIHQLSVIYFALLQVIVAVLPTVLVMKKRWTTADEQHE